MSYALSQIIDLLVSDIDGIHLYTMNNPLDGVKDSVRTIDGVVEELSKRKDIKNLLLVIDDFCKSANIVLTAFQNDGHYVAAKKVLKK